MMTFGGIGMTVKSSERSSVAVFIAVLILSSATMLFLFWKHPLATAGVTFAILTVLGILAVFARSIEVEKPDLELDQGEQRLY
jgi:membrane protein implicated in regulation of membrane protease activity